MVTTNTVVKWSKIMGLYLRLAETINIPLKLNTFEGATSEFVLKGNSVEYGETEVRIMYPLKVDNRYTKDDYEMYFFFNKKFAENDIFQVYEHDNKSRLGWAFPLQSLLSDSHNYAENPHFLPYAFVAFEKLLRAEVHNLNEVSAVFRVDGHYSLSDFFNSDETIVMIFDRKLTRKIVDFDLYNYIPCLYSKGYYWSPGEYRRSLERGDDALRLNIRSISQSVKSEDFVIQLFKELLVYEKHHLVKFYLLYQVIELLIEKIFNKELASVLNDLSSQSKTLFQVKDKLDKLSNEKKRISRLFTVYTSTNGSKSILMESCNRLLTKLSRKTLENSAESLYSVRNLFVHEYRSIPSTEVQLIEVINDDFENAVIEILYEVNNIS